MQVKIISPGKTKLPGASELIQHYTRLASRFLPVSTEFIKVPKRVGQQKKELSEFLVGTVPEGFQRIVLDERGKQISSKELATMFANWKASPSTKGVAFLIGGADGFDLPTIKRLADDMISLSKLTLPHDLARVVLAEQIFRALSILENHPYHRE